MSLSALCTPWSIDEGPIDDCRACAVFISDLSSRVFTWSAIVCQPVRDFFRPASELEKRQTKTMSVHGRQYRSNLRVGGLQPPCPRIERFHGRSEERLTKFERDKTFSQPIIWTTTLFMIAFHGPRRWVDCVGRNAPGSSSERR
jgi:hypothetical protein